MRQFCARGLGFLLLAMGLFGLALQFTVRDRIAGLAVLFYALPPLVIVGATLVSAGLLSRRAPLPWVVLSVVAAVLALVTWVRTDFVRATPATATGNLRVVLWNIASPKDPEPLARIMEETHGQVILLLESAVDTKRRHRLWQSHFPHHSIRSLNGNATLLSEYPVSNLRTHTTGKRTRIHTCDLCTPSGTVSLVLVDIESNLSSGRGPLVARACEIASSLPAPAIVLGDFNTPYTSAFFREFHGSFQHAFASSGTGLIPTWPAVCPLLALDHVWLSPDVTPVRTWTLRTFHSDHAAVIADVTVNAVAPRESATGSGLD